MNYVFNVFITVVTEKATDDNIQDNLKRQCSVDHNDIAVKTPFSDILSAEKVVENSNAIHMDNKVEHSNNNIIQTLQPLYLMSNWKWLKHLPIGLQSLLLYPLEWKMFRTCITG